MQNELFPFGLRILGELFGRKPLSCAEMGLFVRIYIPILVGDICHMYTYLHIACRHPEAHRVVFFLVIVKKSVFTAL